MTETEVTTTETTETTTEVEQPKKVEFSAEQSEWISRKIASELKSDREKRALADADAKKKAEAEAERKKQEEAGEFETVKQSLQQERDAAAQERDRLQAERDEYRDLVTKDVEAAWENLPEEVREAYEGDADDVLAKKRHMARMAKVIAKLTAEDSSNSAGNGPGPKPAGNGQGKVESPLSKRQILG